VNALGPDTPVEQAYAADVWERLVEIKLRYDPDGVFAGNGIG
jgi:FAD/FMN-containing dehydrogenase